MAAKFVHSPDSRCANTALCGLRRPRGQDGPQRVTQRRRAAEAAKFGLRHVISPESAPTLRDALRAVLSARAPQAT